MTTYDLTSPIGLLRLTAEDGRLTSIQFQSQHGARKAHYRDDDPVLEDCARQLEEYFAGKRKAFDLPLDAGGTAFQREVWGALGAIPYGEVRSYRDIAHVIKREKAVRAVGAANGRNPLPIVVPCHRVIGTNGTLTGFAGGLDAKKTLLELEGALPR